MRVAGVAHDMGVMVAAVPVVVPVAVVVVVAVRAQRVGCGNLTKKRAHPLAKQRADNRNSKQDRRGDLQR